MDIPQINMEKGKQAVKDIISQFPLDVVERKVVISQSGLEMLMTLGWLTGFADGNKDALEFATQCMEEQVKEREDGVRPSG